MTRHALLYQLLLLCTITASSLVSALRVSSASLSNASVSAILDLRVSLDLQGDAVPADAVFTLSLHHDLMLDASLSVVSTALLSAQLDGTIQTNVNTTRNTVLVTREANGSDVRPTEPLVFQVVNVTAPSVAGYVNLGFVAVGNSTHPEVQWLALPAVWISPGRMWNTRVAFAHLISGRATAFSVELAPGHDVPSDGSLLLHLPREYASIDALGTVVLSRFEQADAPDDEAALVSVVNGSVLQVTWDSSARGTGIKAMQKIVLHFGGLQHPATEGPVGRLVRVDTTNALGNLIDQTSIDASQLFLERASVTVNRSRVLVKEGSPSGAKYVVGLTASPQYDAGVSVVISSSLSSAINVLIEPDYVHFSKSNWSAPINVSVRVPDDSIALPASPSLLLSHSIAESSTETTFAPGPNVSVDVEDDDLPVVHVSSRYAAVVEGLQNDSYTLVLSSQPTSDVVITIESASLLVQTLPTLITFTPLTWNTPQSVLVFGIVGASVVSTSTRTTIQHRVSSADALFGEILPQSIIHVYFEPLNMVACPEPCRPGWFPFINTTTGLSQCFACPLGHFCPGGCALPTGCSPGTFSDTSFATSNMSCQVCPSGSYSNLAGMTACLPCPAGAQCSNISTLFEPCPVGTYSEMNQVICRPCPAGTHSNSSFRERCDPCPSEAYCAGGPVAPVVCPPGQFIVGNGTEPCQACPIGFMCRVASESPQRCPDGTYSAANATECKICEPGYYCPNPALAPIKCSQGTYSLAGATSCAVCPYGYTCTFPDPPRACSAGQVNNADHSACILCPRGFECSPLQGGTTSCAAGSYSLDGEGRCTQCPKGHACPVATSAPVRCSSGTYSPLGSSDCFPCPAGFACPQPSMDPVSCGASQFSLASSTSCSSCPAGKACPVVASAPIDCPAGSFSTGGTSSCTPCPPGYACPDTTTNQRLACAVGTYSTGGAATCTPCPAGFSCQFTNSSVFSPCPPGYYSPDGSASCLECPRGYYCDVPYEMPKNCSVGSYSLKGSTSCIPCAPGYECPRSDQLPQPCPVGYYSEGAVANCRSCRPGYMCSLASKNPTPPEDACPMGGYCNPPTTFFLCPAGTYGNVTAGESVDHACAPCPEGYYCEMGSTPLTKQNCPSGFMCPVGTKRASQFPCPAGTYNRLPNQRGFESCLSCPAGSYCEAGSSEPVLCPKGYFCVEGTQSATQYPCPAGTYSGPRTGLTVATECLPCELGSYCPEGSSSPTACPAGTYNPSAGSARVHECLACPPGYACPHVGQFEFVDRCAKGHYCPSGTVVATANPCPAGTYTERIDLIRAEDCTICPLRHACPQGTGGEAQTMLDCGAGFFCPNGTAYSKQFPCPPGTWSSSTSLADPSECSICPVGKYCSGGKYFIDGDCNPGYYCPLGTPSPTKFPCPSGTYTAKTWLFEPSQCDDCPPGYYCPAGSVAPIPCKPGSYTSLNNTKSVGPGAAWPECTVCPAGYYCTDGSIAPVSCGKGSYSPKGSKSCAKCEAGYFCNSNTTSDANMRADAVSWLAPGSLFGKCYNGTYCPPGTDHEPALELDACPRGYFCPKATPAPVICPAGTYSNLTGQDEMSDCVPTPAGFYSLEGALQPTGKCDPGFYCPERSTSRMQIPCPARYYLNRTGGQREEDCAVCVSGAYCPRGSAHPIVCPMGYYCRTGVSSPEPCPIGTYSNVTGIKQVEDCVLCPPGMYCDSTGLTVPRGSCDPGYYCTIGSYTSAPMDYETTLFGITNRHVGGQCPRGSYCPLASALPTACPPGTFNNFTGLETETQCVPCPPGKYCETPGLYLPTGDCFSGYYCTGGASTPTQFPTQPGYFSGNGSTAPVPCPAGQFNTYAVREQCVECPAGFYCGSPGTIRPTICLTGSYCPRATALAIKCPPGTFNTLEGLISVDQCEPCPAGYFCDSFGLTDPSGPCFEGFVCTGGSPVANPVDPLFGFVCPPGHYCPQGSGAPTQCPRGSFRPTTGGVNVSSCTLCPDGSFCDGTALISPSGLCSEGYYCKRGNDVSTPTSGVAQVNGVHVGGDLCPIGSYCPEGTSQPKLCPEGSFIDTRGASVCTTCPAGFFCPLGSSSYAANACPQGYFCPAGTKRGLDNPCLPGTFGNRTGLQNITQCTLAPGGMYVEDFAATRPTGLCKSGFYCSGGSPTSTPSPNSTTGGPCLKGTNCPEGSAIPIVCAAGFYCSSTNTEKALPCDPGFYCVQGSYTATPTGELNALGSIGDVCTPGHYCPQGTSNPIPCPPGTYSENTQNANVSQCSPCLPGYVCSASGIVAPYQKCPAGYLCTGGEREATEKCPMGSECPEGSSAPRSCPAGTFSDEGGLGQCKLCPERYFCLPGSITPERCPAGYYCPLHTPFGTKYPCPIGTFSNETSLASSSECASCPPGNFCSGVTPTDRPSGDCAPGHYCAGGATTATPTDGVTGGYCAEGHICIGAAWLPDPVDGLTGSGCQPGFYCPRGSSSQSRCEKGTYNAFEKKAACVKCPAGGYCDTNATTPVPCPFRYYCPEGVVEPVLCPSGTYGHAPGLESAAQCAPCAAGKYCVGGTLTASCAAGYYCKLYNQDPNPVAKVDFGGPCPVGHYCPEGVLDPIPCPNSTARLETHGTRVEDCGPCPAGMSCENGAVTVPCPAGYYCAQAKSAVPCPIGTYNPAESKSIIEDCLVCKAGKLCNRTAIVELTEYDDCPAAHYCPEGTIEPSPCPIGRFRRTTGGESVSDCALCSGGSYCEVGTAEPIVCEREVYCPTGSGKPIVCPGGAFCPYNSTAPSACPAGYYCPIGVSLPITCERGFYCPPGCAAPLACPLGYIGRLTPLSGVLGRLNDACESCPAGTYGIDPNRTKCELCLEGFVCLEAARSDRPKAKEVDNGYPCPPGHYCPAGSSKEVACPSGTYQPNLSATNSSACRPCPVNSYQNNPAQTSCFPCSKSSYAAEGATKCTCKGSHRAFQMTDGYCICEPGYEFYDQNMVLRSDEDDDVDCQPIVYDRCGSNQVRSDGGNCVSASQVSCETTCGNRTGALVSSLGVCQCDDQADIDLVCDKVCRETAMQVQVNATTGGLQLFDPVTGSIEPLPEGTSSGIISRVSCASSSSGSDCQLHTVALKSSGFAGSYDVPSGIASTSPSARRSRRRLDTDGAASIDNPLVCLNVGQGILFDISTPGSYPIYMKDSMLNTNPDFDFGAFRALATRVRANASTLSAFAFSFTEPGAYVFGNSLNGAAKTVITVMQSGTTCPTEAPIVPLSEKSLIAVSAKRRTDDIILAPDWGLIVGLLGGLMGMVISIIAGLYYFRTKSWATSSFRKRVTGYRALNKATDLSSMHSKGAAMTNKLPSAMPDGETKEVIPAAASTLVLDDGIPPLVGSPRWAKSPTAKGEDGGYKPDLERWDEEDLDLRELVDRLQYHHDAVTKCFDDQKGDVNKLLQQMQVEAAELKRLFVDSVANQGVASVEPPGEEDVLYPEEEARRASPHRVDDLAMSCQSSVVTDTMERELADRQRFRKRRNAGLEEIASLLKTVEEWGKQPNEQAHAIIEEVASDTPEESEPESTMGGDAATASHLEHIQTVLGDLKTLLCSDPATITNSSVVQIAEAEKARREIGDLVVDAALRKSAQLSSTAGTSGSASASTPDVNPNVNDLAMRSFVDDRDRVIRAANKEDEACSGQLATLKMFGDALPRLVGALDEMESEFKRELVQIREEQNPSKERAARALMEEKLAKFIKELAKGAGRLQGKLAKGQMMLAKSEKATLAEEDLLAAQLRGERQRRLVAAETERAKRLAVKVEKMAAETEAVAPVAGSNGQVGQTKVPESGDKVSQDGETLMQQIKELLLNLSNQQLDTNAGKKSAVHRPATRAEALTPQSVKAAVEPRVTQQTVPDSAEQSSEVAIDSKFAKEEEEIEREYQLELQRLEEEFDGMDEDDESLPPTQREGDDERFTTSYEEEYGDMALPEEHEDEEPDDEVVSETNEQDEYTPRKRQRETERFPGLTVDIATKSSSTPRTIDRMLMGNPEGAEVSPRSSAGTFKARVWQELAKEMEHVKDMYPTALDEWMQSVDVEATRLHDRLCSRLDLKRRLSDAQSERERASAELERIQKEHDQGKQALAVSFNAQRAQERQHLEEKLQQRRREKLDDITDDIEKKRAEVELDAWDELDRCHLDEQITIREVDTLHELANKSSDERYQPLQSVARAEGKLAGIEAARRALEMAAETEVTRVGRELEAALRAARADEIDDRAARKARLVTRLRSGETHAPTRMDQPSGQVQMPGSQNSDHRTVNSPAIVDVIAPAVDASIDEDVQRLQAQYASDVQAQRDQIQRDAVLQKKRLHERIAQKKAALEALASVTGLPGGEDPVKDAEAIATQELERITDRLCSTLDSQAGDRIEAFKAAAIDRAADQSVALEALLAECRDLYNDTISALRESLATERKHQEAALQERLATKRAQRSAAIQAARDENCMPITEDEAATMDASLEITSKHELDALGSRIATEEAEAVRAIEDTYGEEVAAIVSQVHDEAERRKANAQKELERAEVELKRLREEHDRDRRALVASLEAERAQQQQRLHDKLRQRRETKIKAVTNVSEKQRVEAELEAQDELDRVELDGHLGVREQEQLRSGSERQSKEIHEAQLAVARAQGEMAAASAVQRAMEVASEAERQRIASELEDALRAARARESDERATKARRLADRLRSRKATVDENASSFTPRSEIDTQLGREVDARAAATEVMASALDDEVERIKRQYEDGLRRRADQIRAEATAKKALLQARIEEKRKALAMRAPSGGDTGDENEHQIEDEEESGIKAIEDDAAAKMQAAVEDVGQQHEAACATLEEAANGYGDELERMLEECKESHASNVEALHRALKQDQLRQEMTLRERLAKRREKRLADVSDAVEREAAEKELAEEARVEQERLDELITTEQTRQLKEAEDMQQRRVRELVDKLVQSSSERLVAAKADQDAAELELQRVREEHTRELAALQHSLDAEKKRQEQRLHDKLVAKRARRAQESASGLSPDQAAELDAEEALERVRLEAVLQKRAAEALEEEGLRHEERERTLQLQIARAAAEAAAAGAARRAVDAARQAEMDRIAAEFKAARRRKGDEEASDSQAHKTKLAARLADKRARREKLKAGSNVQAKMMAAVQRAASISKSLRSITDTKAQQEIERLKEEHAAACKERFAALEQDAALRKARLAERISKKRAEMKEADTVSQATGDVSAIEVLLHEEERAELQSIDESMAAEKQCILDELARAQEQVSAAMQEAAQRNTHELEMMLSNCKKAHEEESKSLQKALDLERQRQERALQDRIAKRKAMKIKEEMTLSSSVKQSADTSSETQMLKVSAVDEADEEREKRELEAELEAREVKMWEDMRHKQEEELLALTKQAETIAQRKQQEAKMVQESAQQELDRLKQEHEVEMAALTSSLEAEQKRQQEQLQQRIAARRNRQQKQQKEVQDAAERERLAQQLEEQERADKLALEQAIEAEMQRKIEEERERQRQQEAEVAARIAQAGIDAAAADAASKAMDAARELELERLAKEFEEKSRELRQSDLADLVSQKRKLEARVSAKKQKRLMELEAKKELEKQKLRERLEQESQRDARVAASGAADSHAQTGVDVGKSGVHSVVLSRSDTGNATTRRPGSAMLRATLTGLLEDDSSDLKRMIELRLRKIEALLTRQTLPVDGPVQVAEPKHIDEVDSEQALRLYKVAVHTAIEGVCQWRVMVNASDDMPLQVVSRESMDGEKQTRFDFVNTLLRMMAANTDKKSAVRIARVVVANALPTKRFNDTTAHSTYLDPVTQTLFMDAACFDQLSIGQIALLLIHALVEAETGSNDVADPIFIGHVYRLLVRCYETMFLEAQRQGRDDHQAENNDSIAPLLPMTPCIRRVQSAVKHKNGDVQLRDGVWRAHVDDLRGFLTGLEAVAFPAANAIHGGDAEGSPRTSSGALRRQAAAAMAAMSMSRSSSRFLLGSTEGSTNDMEELVVHERRQFLHEKLDTAEKLYAHVLRQFQEQKESIEYVQEMLMEEQERETHEDHEAQSEKLEELRQELVGMEQALESTRRERDELFRQCQSLRHELEQLPRSRPTTVDPSASLSARASVE